MTPQEKEAHKFSIMEKQAKARVALPKKDQEIYHFLKSYWDSLGDGFNADVHEKPALAEAAKRFGVTVGEAQKAFESVDGAGLDL